MNVLGIGHDLWIAGAALVQDGNVRAAICEERLNHQKGFQGFPSKAIDYCLKEAGLRLDDLDLIVCGWNPAWHLESPHGRFSSRTRWWTELLYAVPNLTLPKAETFPFGPIEQKFGEFKAPFVYLDHQVAHAANAYYLSGFEEAAVFSADGRGERHTALGGKYGPGGLDVMARVVYPHSMGLFYGLVTQYLGFKPHSDEWKVMALASYSSGTNNPFYAPIRDMVTPRGDGGFKLDLAMTAYPQPDSFGARFYTDEFVEAMGMAPRKSDEPLGDVHMQVAWALQKVFEETMADCLTTLHERTGSERVVLSGGCMMNSVFNGRVTGLTPFNDVFISSCPDDSGIPVGAAMWGYYEHLRAGDPAKRPLHKDNYWGPSFDGEIEETLQRYKLSYEKLDNAPEAAAALLADGKLLGWYQGRMEFGQRALGNRSILADPRRAEVKDLVNQAVKFREGFRPFAPSILADRAEEYFHLDGAGPVPFMERVLPFRDEVKESVPGVVHADGTGRLQTVTADGNPRYHALITAFESITGIPLVLNTSFNLNGEAIVCTPTDAIRTFHSCGLDALIMGDFLLRKA